MTPKLTITSAPGRAPGVIEAQVDEELVLWHEGRMHRLDPVGAVVWRTLDGNALLADLATELAGGFGVEPDVVAADVVGLCRRLAEEGLLADPFTHRLATRLPVDSSGAAVGPGPEPAPLSTGLRWAHSAGPFRGVSFSFAIRSTDAAIGRYLERALGSMADCGPAAHVYSVVAPRDLPGSYEIHLDDLGLVCVPSPDRAVRQLLWHVNSEVIRWSTGHLLVHAGGAVVDGSAVVLPGPMNAGKSTLVAGLVRDGFGYLTDELVALNLASGLVDPYPRPLNLSEGSWALLPELRPPRWSPGDPMAPQQWHVDLGALRSDALAGPSPPRFVVEPRFEAGAEARLEPLSRGAALQVLHDQAMNPQIHGEAGFGALVELTRTASCVRVVAGALPPAVRLVREVVNGHFASPVGF